MADYFDHMYRGKSYPISPARGKYTSTPDQTKTNLFNSKKVDSDSRPELIFKTKN